ncbi:hypothetical protein KKB40_04405 [Patescibacteria group bacterium]|nr:hypothetical protein [Patescibacteria group bacterium]
MPDSPDIRKASKIPSVGVTSGLSFISALEAEQKAGRLGGEGSLGQTGGGEAPSTSSFAVSTFDIGEF